MPANADDHRTRTIDPPPPETQVERSGASSCSPHLSQILGYEVEYGPELRFTPEPERIGNRLVLGEYTKMEVV